MPRRVKGVVSLKTRQKTSGRRRASAPSRYVDTSPEIKGTEPEKVVVNRLLLNQIPFIFQGYLTVNLPDLDILKDYRPDIILPDLKIIIEVQGSYWHSTESAIESDAYKAALYEAMGYKVLAWWDYEIMSNLDRLWASVPELAMYTGRRGGRVIADKQSFRDDSAGIRTMNKRRAKGAKQTRLSARGQRKAIDRRKPNSWRGKKSV